MIWTCCGACPPKIEASPARYIARLEDDVVFLRGQLAVKDKTIDALLERDRESNILVGQLTETICNMPDSCSSLMDCVASTIAALCFLQVFWADTT